MKAIIFSFLLFYSFCSEMIEVKNSNFYSFASGTTKFSYIDISKYSQNDVIHFCFIVRNGEMDKLITYGFSDSIPNEYTLIPYSKSTTYAEYYCNDNDDYYYYDRECGYKYYFDIEKKENKKYIWIQFTGYTGTSLTYSFMLMSSKTVYIIVGVVIFVLCVIFVVVFNIRRRRAQLTTIASYPTSTQTALVPSSDDQPYVGN